MVFWNPISHAHTLVRFETTVKQIKQAAYQILDTLMQYKVYLDMHIYKSVMRISIPILRNQLIYS